SRREVAEVMNRFTLLRVDVTRQTDTTDDLQNRYDAGTLPSVRIVSPEGKLLAKIVDGELIHADKFREKLLAALPANSRPWLRAGSRLPEKTIAINRQGGR